MSLQYLLDGYNIIYQIPQLAKGSLNEQRAKLIALVDIKRPQGSRNNPVTIVFDGKEDVFGGEKHSSIKVIFSKDETADEKILRLVDAAKNRKNMVVVTNDRAVQYAVRALGSQVISVHAFIKKADPKLVQNKAKKTIGKKHKEAPKDISKSLELEITSEMEDIWLDGKKD